MRIHILIASTGRSATCKKTVMAAMEQLPTAIFSVLTYNKDRNDYDWLYDEPFYDKVVTRLFLPNNRLNQVGFAFNTLIAEAKQTEIIDNEDNYFMILGDNARFKIKSGVATLANIFDQASHVVMLAAFAHIYEMFHNNPPELYYGGGNICGVCFITRSVIWDHVQFEKNLHVCEDTDLTMQILKVFGAGAIAISKDFTYTKRRHEEGGIDNHVKQDPIFMQSIADFINEKWGAEYVKTGKPDKKGFVTFRTQLMKFKKDRNIDIISGKKIKLK